MAIAGSAILPALQGMVVDCIGMAGSFVIPAGCFLVVASYAGFDLRSSRH